jgi:hypothetical protein
VQHDDGWPFTANSEVNRRAISFDLFDAETGRESGNFCHAVISTTGTPDSFASVTGLVGPPPAPTSAHLAIDARLWRGTPRIVRLTGIHDSMGTTQSEGCALR